jgi:hypothetical protein
MEGALAGRLGAADDDDDVDELGVVAGDLPPAHPTRTAKDVRTIFCMASRSTPGLPGEARSRHRLS